MWKIKSHFFVKKYGELASRAVVKMWVNPGAALQFHISRFSVDLNDLDDNYTHISIISRFLLFKKYFNDSKGLRSWRRRDWIFSKWTTKVKKNGSHCTQLATIDRILHAIFSYSSFNNILGRKVKNYKEAFSQTYFQCMYLVWNYTIGDAFMGVRVEPGSRPNCSLQTEWLSFSCAGTSLIGWEFEKFKRSSFEHT